MKPRVNELFAQVLDLLWPRHCFFCGTSLHNTSGYRHACADCLHRIDFIRPPFCASCGHPHFEELSADGHCAACRNKNFSFCPCRSLFEFNGVGRALIHGLKYHGGRHLLADIGSMGLELAPQLAGKILVPVPLHWRRRWMRGYNQSELICRALSRTLHCRIVPLLLRRRHTISQVGMGWQRRRSNVEGAFAVRRKLAEKLALAREEEIVLVDDVLTTGATMDACAVSLREQGFVNISAFTLART